MINWITHHQLASFFAITFLFSWTIYAVVAVISPQNSTTLSRILLIAAYGPSLSAILLSSITSPQSGMDVSARYLVLFIPVLVLVAGIEWLDHIWWGHRIDASLIPVDVILVLLAAMVITRLLANRTDIHLSFAGLTHWYIWIPVALGFWPLLVLAGNAIARLSGLSLPPTPAWPDIPLPFILLESLLWAFLYGGPLNEEPGWRGFALPRLQGRFSPLVASIILGAFWGLWHVPLHLMGVYPGGVLGALIRFQEIPRAILFTWLYNRTKSNLLVMILFHAAINTTSYFIARSYEVVFILVFFVAIFVVISDKMWRMKPYR